VRTSSLANSSVAAARSQTLSKVLGILGSMVIFTALGAALAPHIGVEGFVISASGSFVCLIVLNLVKEQVPVNAILLYVVAAMEGVMLGSVMERYVNQGMGLVVTDAAASTAVVTIIAGTYGYTSKRNLSGGGGFLFMGLIGLIVAGVIGVALQVSLFALVLSAATSVLFVGFLAFDLNRITNAGDVSPGDAILLAVSVYLDILNLFLALLRILSYFADDT
jgi:modulator of FtsH protease